MVSSIVCMCHFCVPWKTSHTINLPRKLSRNCDGWKMDEITIIDLSLMYDSLGGGTGQNRDMTDNPMRGNLGLSAKCRM